MKLREFFSLPGPKELGMSDSDALGMRRSMTPFQEGPTWEDWHERVREMHPVKYFLLERVIPATIWPVERKLKDAWYWVKCHTLTRYRFHLLDLRGVDPVEKYTHGYLDPSSVMELAAWAALRFYVEKELANDPRYTEPSGYTEEEQASDWYKEQKHQSYDEPMALYKYWMEERFTEKSQEEALFARVKATGKLGDEATSREAQSEWLIYHRACEVRRQTMFMRLCAIREHLWS